MSIPTILALALLLDAAFGEPKWVWSRLPHPAVLMGRLIGWMDRTMNTGPAPRANGILAVLVLCFGAWWLGKILHALPDFGLFELILVAILIAQRSLVQHVRDVARTLSVSLSEGRRAVARIVGRDTGEMDAPAVARSAIESAAENLSDGVVAPALAYLAFGLPGLLVYKFVNTADSMIGYRTPEHEEFGWAAARLDDVLNWIPARLTALALTVASSQLGDWRAIMAEAGNHRSPNAGWPEAAMARAVGVALSGPRSYDGALRDFPFVNPLGSRTPGPPDIQAAIRWLWAVWAILLGLSLVISALS